MPLAKKRDHVQTYAWNENKKTHGEARVGKRRKVTQYTLEVISGALKNVKHANNWVTLCLSVTCFTVFCVVAAERQASRGSSMTECTNDIMICNWNFVSQHLGRQCSVICGIMTLRILTATVHNQSPNDTTQHPGKTETWTPPFRTPRNW